jgi:hypothetical protein
MLGVCNVNLWIFFCGANLEKVSDARSYDKNTSVDSVRPT